MASSHSREASRARRDPFQAEDDSILGTALTSRQLEAFGRKVTTTANHLMGDGSNSVHYNQAMSSLHKQLRRPGLQRGIFSFTQTTPTDLVRSKLSTSEISHRAVTYIPDELLVNIPEETSTYSLFQGFQATLPEQSERGHHKGHRRRISKGSKLLEGGSAVDDGPPTLKTLKREQGALNHRLEMIAIRKNMCSTEIHEIDNKIANLTSMRKIVLDRLADIEIDESRMEHELLELESQIEDLQELEDEGAIEESTGTITEGEATPETQAEDASFMSESIYEKLPSPASKKRPHKNIRRKSMPVLHEHLEAGSCLKTIPAHNDNITALDFDLPFGTMVTAALDDTVRVWDLNLGRCMGFLEGHTASVRCLQMEDNIVATGSMDASIRLWDLSHAKYDAFDASTTTEEEEEDGLNYGNEEDEAQSQPAANAMADCPIFSLEAHVDSITALHLKGETLVSGSADKTLRQWDLVKGRCVQTLDVLWAAAQASATIGSEENQWRPLGRAHDINADFVGALQCFDAALACGTADGMVRLWDLRSGQVHRSLVGHTGPVTCLQFDDVHLVTGSADRSIRIWDLRTGSIFDAYAYDNPITSMNFDNRRIASAACEDVVKIYDKTEGRQWDCGAGTDANVDNAEVSATKSIIDRVRIKDGYMIEGRKNGIVGVWSC